MNGTVDTLLHNHNDLLRSSHLTGDFSNMLNGSNHYQHHHRNKYSSPPITNSFGPLGVDVGLEEQNRGGDNVGWGGGGLWSHLTPNQLGGGRNGAGDRGGARKENVSLSRFTSSSPSIDLMQQLVRTQITQPHP